MNREDIIKLAREVGYPLVKYEGTPYIPPLLAVLLETVAAQRPWVDLTEDELVQIGVATGLERAAVEMISNKLKEKNT
jgi:hypothetical protein